MLFYATVNVGPRPSVGVNNLVTSGREGQIPPADLRSTCNRSNQMMECLHGFVRTALAKAVRQNSNADGSVLSRELRR